MKIMRAMRKVKKLAFDMCHCCNDNGLRGKKWGKIIKHECVQPNLSSFAMLMCNNFQYMTNSSRLSSSYSCCYYDCICRYKSFIVIY